MISRIIEWSMRNRLLVVCATLLLSVVGFWSMMTMPVDAIPDLGENQVLVYADWPGRGPQEVETQLTQPLSLSLQGLAGLKSVRGTSMFGFSLVQLIFEDGVKARPLVLERLGSLRGRLPVEPVLGPDASGLGWVFQYFLAASGEHDLGELRTLQDTVIRPQLASVPGVAEIASVGGLVKQYQIEVDPAKMRVSGISLKMLLEAVEEGSASVGGKTIEENGMEFIVRGAGWLRNAADIEKIVLMEKNGMPVLLKDIARVEVGGDFRRGTLDFAGGEVVGGIVVMRSGENALAVIDGVKAKIAQIQPSLPAGVVIRPFYDRSTLIERSLETLRTALSEEIILVILAHIFFLWHFRSIWIVTLPLPVSILVSFIALKALGITSNIMSLCGIVMAVGVLVDGAIVMTENVIRQCSIGFPACDEAQPRKAMLPVILAAAKQVGRPVFFAMAIILLAFVPVFALSGQEGRLFHPLAFAKTFAMLAAAVLSITLVPAMCAFLMSGPFPAENRNWIMQVLLRVYEPVLDWSLRHSKTVLGLAAVVFASSLLLVKNIGSQFMPPLNEGSLLFMPTFVPGTSLTEVKRVMAWQDQVFANIPEVELAVGKLGRADTATDPAPVEMIETTITLKPEREWRAGMTREKLIAEMTARLQQVPGSIPGFIQPIEGRVLMLSTGIRAHLGIKLLGDDLDVLQKWALEVEKLVREVPGATGVAASRVQGRPYLQITPDREALAQRGLRMREVLDVIETGLGGTEAGFVTEGRARVPVQLRLQRGERDDIERVRDLMVKNVPLGQIASIQRIEGPNEITSEDGRLRVSVQANVEGRDAGSFVDEVREKLSHELLPRLPAGITLTYSGDHEHLAHAQRTLMLIVPCVLLIVFLLLHQVYHSAREAAHVLLAVPFALSGGFALQWAMQIPFSVAVWVGYIALFGTAIQTAIVMVVYLEESVARGGDLLQAVKDGARLRLRPKVMTVATIVASLLPVLWSTQTGSEVMKPIAVPVIGGMLSSLLHVLLVTPVLFLWMRRGQAQREACQDAPASISVP